jgi:catechol 2,3-dioxygenase-like lactoylglutathione lyase family enzyme
MSFRLHHIHLLCSDLEQTEQFFIQNLGAHMEERTTFGGAPGSKLVLNDAKLYLRTAKSQETVIKNESHTCYGFHHFGLQVEDLASVYDDLHSAGVKFTVPPKDTPSGRLAFIKGPDDILIELYQSKD